MLLENVTVEPKVNFVVAGMQKGGTQALNHFLSQHPEIGIVSPPKIAPHFFDIDDFFKSGCPNYQTYHDWFTDESLSKVTGDITPIYTYWRPCIERIKVYNPDMKVVVLLRNPVDRAYSHWNMEYNRGNENRQFFLAMLSEPLRRGFFDQHPVYSYIHRGFYSRQIENLFKYFSKDQCLFIRNEDLKKDHEETLKRVFTFLGVDSTYIPERLAIHQGQYDHPMNSVIARLLRGVFRKDLKKVQALTGINVGDWLTA